MNNVQWIGQPVLEAIIDGVEWIKMGLKESKKWAVGSKHENGGGKFEILDRWFDDKTDTIMLKYKYENGTIEENKEANVNASEWKWRKVRGLAGSKSEHKCVSDDFITPTFMEEYFEGVYVRLAKLSDENKHIMKQISDSQLEQTNILIEQSKKMIELMAVINVQQKQLDALTKESAIINKLLERI